MKKRMVVLFSLLVAALCCIALAACGNKGVTLKDFPAETTETVELGNVYELKTQAEDEDGKTYRLSTKVRTKDDVAVPVFENRFDVTDVSGYVITYTAITGDNTQKSVVNLNVTDNTAPIIGINKPDAGVLNEEYCLPVITVSDLAGTKPTVTVKVYHVDGDVRTEVTDLTERDGRYYFTPTVTGNYDIEVTAEKENGQSKTTTRSFVVDTPVGEGEVFSPEVFDPSSQIRFVAAGGVAVDKLSVNKVTPSETEGAYTGSYLSINGKDVGTNVWVDIRLTPRLETEEYSDYDTVEFWVYFKTTSENVKIGLLGGSTAATDPLLREFAGNTWAKVSVDADTFFDKIGSQRLFTVNFNNTSSSNHAGVEEIRIGSVTAKYTFAPTVVVDAPEAAPDGVSTVALTADTKVEFTAEIRNAEGTAQNCIVENGTVTAQLPMGAYTYTLISADDMYVGSVSGSFTVESNTKIVLPETAENGVAGEEYTLPAATVTVNGEQTIAQLKGTASFTQEISGNTQTVEGDTFTPFTAGTLTIVYTYEGAASQTLTIEIDAAQPAGNVIFSAAAATSGNIVSNTGAQKFEAKAGDSSAVYTGYYIEITAPGASGWSNTRLTLGLDADSYAEYDKVGVWVYFAAEKDVTHSLFNDNVYKTVYAPNEWHFILVDRAAFVAKMTGTNKDLLALNFNKPENGNFPNLTSVRLGEIVALHDFDNAAPPQDTSVNEGETVTVTITVNENAKDIAAVIENKDGERQDCTVSGNLITASLPIGEYTYEITTTDPAYTGTITGSFIINSKTQIILPDETGGIAMQEFTIPQAAIMVDGATTQDVAEHTAIFTPYYGGAVVENITAGTFTPASSGKLVITYSYEGAVSKTFVVLVKKAENTTGALLDMRNADMLANISTNDASTSVAYDADGQYLSWTGRGNWKQLKINFNTTVSALQESSWQYLKVQVYYRTNKASGNVTGWFCGGKLKIGTIDNAEGKIRQIPHDTWYTVYIPLERLTDEMLKGSKDFLQAGFGLVDGGHFPLVQEVRLKGFVPVTAPDDETVFFDMSDPSVANKFTKPSGTFEYVAAAEEERAYLSWKGKETWQSLYLDPKTRANCNAETVYKYVAVELYYVSTDPGEVDVSGYFLKGSYLVGSGNNGADIGIKANKWVTVYLPVDTFYSSNTAAGTGYLLQCSFNVSGNGHFPGITEVRIGNIYFTNNNEA